MWLPLAFLLVLAQVPAHSSTPPRKPAPAPRPFTPDLAPSEMTNKQAVVDTTAGTFVIDLRPDVEGSP